MRSHAVRITSDSSAIRWGFVAIVSVLCAGMGASGCLDRPLCASTTEGSSEGLPEGFSGDCNPKTTNVFVTAIAQSRVDKIDLLFMIDNSISMADKQALLAEAVPDLVRRLVNPVCVADLDGVEPETLPAPDIRSDCPDGYSREFSPVRDIHVGVISSSLGSYGASTCVGEHNDDKAHLVGSLPRAADLMLSGAPFLSWFVTAEPNEPEPPGTFSDVDVFEQRFQSMVGAVEDQGCGYEASLEAWYRFLVDPAPPGAIELSPCSAGSSRDCAHPVGIDRELLEQRAAFLRPDSLVAIVMLSDENDCSIQGTGQLYYAAASVDLPKASAACATNPNDPCCYSCGLREPPADCEKPDPTCKDERGEPVLVPEALDKGNLRCFQQKERFGLDFLYPTERYVNALRSFELCTARADLSPADCDPEALVPNPLYQDLSGSGAGLRSQGLVYLAGIVGVPWQDIRDGEDDEGNAYPDRELHFQPAAEMTERDTWSVILGHPDGPPDQGGRGVPVPPSDPLMRESILPRSGSNPVTGDPVANPESAFDGNPMNGHEWNIDNDDLQYACVFDIEPFDCEDREDCDCPESGPPEETQNPLCQDPATGQYSTIQRRAKAYPGLRFLEVLRDYGDNSIVASICPRNADPNAQDFGYRPAIGAIVDRLKDALEGPCLPRAVPVTRQPDGTLDVPCSVVEAVPEPNAGCGRPGRRPADPRVTGPAFRRLEEMGRCGGETGRACNQSRYTLCEVKQAGEECLTAETVTSEVGWCYVDPGKGLGSESLVQKCDDNERRLLRFVDPEGDLPAKNATVLVACLGEDLGVGEGAGGSAAGGG